MPSSYKTALSQYVSDFAVSNYGPTTDFSVAQQYYDLTGPGATKNFVPYALSNGGIIADTAAYPANGCTDSDNSVTLPKCLNDTQIRAEIQRLVVALHLPQNQNTEYALFTPHNVGSCFTSSSTSCAYAQYCGYHSFFSSPGGQIVYTNMPWSYNTAGCDANKAFSMGYANGSAIDPEVGVYSHELIETMTDVHLNAWFDSSGNEIGDKCAYNYNGTTYGSSTGLANNGLGFYNQVSNGGQYLMQTEYSNRNSNGSSTGCVGKNTDTQPSFTVSPTTATRGVARTFTATVTDSNGVAYLDWSFGDGTAGVRTFTCTFTSPTSHCSTSHTYPTTVSAGSKTLSVIVTDKHGSQKRVNTTITVS
jgi:hypothetical protein